jgi:hypothetical protein
MGFIKDLGEIIPYEQSRKDQKKLIILAAEQFLNAFEKQKNWKKQSCYCEIKWG